MTEPRRRGRPRTREHGRDPGHTIRIPDTTWVAAADLAKQRGETMGDIIRHRLHDYITEHVEPRREDERSLWLNIAAAAKVVQDPAGVIDRARQRLQDLRATHTHGRSDKWLDRWQQILDDGPHAILEVMTTRTDEAQALRSTSPLPTDLLTTEERTAVLAAFRAHWRTQHRRAA